MYDKSSLTCMTFLNFLLTFGYFMIIGQFEFESKTDAFQQQRSNRLEAGAGLCN